MLGNDLIDLQKAAIDSNWQRKGYLDKIFSEEEKLLILNSENPSTLVWLFWSMKEATYKIINRETGLRFYNPTAFTCKNIIQEQTHTGEVKYKGKIYYTKSSITATMIHTIALLKGQDFDKVEVAYLANIPYYMAAFNSKLFSYDLAKNKNGIPELIHRNSGAKRLASISHHGNFLAIVSLG